MKCPACRAEIDDGVATCPACGAPLDALDDSLSDVDNSAAIDQMLKSATQLMKDTEQFSFDDGEDSDEDYDDEEEDKSPEPPKPEEIKATSVPPQLTREQEIELNNGGVVDLTTLQGEAISDAHQSEKTHKKKKEEKKGKGSVIPKPEPVPEPEGQASARTDFLSSGDDAVPPPPAVAGSGGSSQDEKQDQKQFLENNKKNKHKNKKDKKDKKDKKEKKAKKKKTSAVAMTVWLVLMVVIGGAVGFFLRGYLFSGEDHSSQYAFAQKATASLQQTLGTGESLLIYDAYVRVGVADTECVIYGGIKTDIGSVENQWFRLVVNNSAPDTVNVYFELDPEYYENLKNSSDSENVILASVLKNYDDALKDAVKQIQSGSNGWVRVNQNLLNSKLNPFETTPEDETTAPSAAPSTEEQLEETGEGADVTDLS